MAHLLPEQQLDLALSSFDIIGHIFPSLPWQQAESSPGQHAPLAQQPVSLPEQHIFASPPSLQQAHFALSPETGGVVCVVLWAIKASAIRSVLISKRAFDFMGTSSVAESRFVPILVGRPHAGL